MVCVQQHSKPEIMVCVLIHANKRVSKKRYSW